jgi:hypothetical protein
MFGPRALTAAERDFVAAERRRWHGIALSTEPIDRSRARSAVTRLYAQAGLRPPTTIVLDSPLQCRLAMATLVRVFGERGLHPDQARLTSNLRVQLIRFDRVPISRSLRQDRWADRVQVPQLRGLDGDADTRRVASLRGAIEGWASEDFGGMLPGDAVAEAAQATARQLTGARWRRVAKRLAAVDGQKRWRERVPDRWLRTTRATLSQRPELIGLMAACAALGVPLHDSCDDALLAALTGLCRDCGPAYLLERWAFIADRPSALHLDQAGRPHKPEGPAIAWRDGAAVHAWRGLRVPSWVIEEPHRITPSMVLAERNAETRRCMIERIGPERFIAACGARLVATDATGKLWRRQFPDGFVWSVVEVVNGTPEPDGSFKRYYLRVPPSVTTAREAVAWTYGLRPGQYQPQVRT